MLRASPLQAMLGQPVALTPGRIASRAMPGPVLHGSICRAGNSRQATAKDWCRQEAGPRTLKLVEHDGLLRALEG